jgi:2-polyprenyl-6-methoxyphenol hydroxylase-like FAD-dependent oxidoreductase
MTQLHDNTTEVLIVGAGPSGLMMACQLAVHGIHFRIIDKKEHPVTYSGALIVHARSVEIFNQMGISDEVVEEAIIANNLSVVFNGKKTVQISLKNIGKGLTKFPNLYLIEQSKTEQLLIDFISAQGCSIERKTELKSFTQDESGVTSILKLPDGKEETIKTQYLIAADGGQSTVREQLKISFAGQTHPVSLFIIDCKAELDIPPDEMCFSFSDVSTSGFFPMKNGRKRIDGVLPEELEGNDNVTFDDIETNFAGRIRMKIRLYYPEWFSVSHSNQRYALSYQQNRCFLVGDAAHTFTPVGAQGMNTGLQDAYNLAWKLAFVIKGKAKCIILDTYSAERQNIAKKLVRSTGRIYNLVTSQNSFTKTFRLQVLPHLMKWILPLIEKRKSFRQFCFNAISEIGINYRKSPISKGASIGIFPDSAPQPGDRLPYLVFTDNDKEINIQEKIKGTGFTLFLFTKDSPPLEIIKVAEKYKNVLSNEIIPFTSETKFLYDYFSIKNGGYYLIRPDMYIAFRSATLNTRHLNNYLQQFLMVHP